MRKPPSVGPFFRFARPRFEFSRVAPARSAVFPMWAHTDLANKKKDDVLLPDLAPLVFFSHLQSGLVVLGFVFGR